MGRSSEEYRRRAQGHGEYGTHAKPPCRRYNGFQLRSQTPKIPIIETGLGAKLCRNKTRRNRRRQK